MLNGGTGMDGWPPDQVVHDVLASMIGIMMNLHAEPRAPWKLAVVPYSHPDAVRLTRALQAEQAETYGFADDPAAAVPEEFAPPTGLFLVATAAGVAVGCGGWRTAAPQVAEVKRMYVSPQHRGRGLGRLILEALEQDAAANRGMTEAILETGVRNIDALELYAACGYVPTASYVPGRRADVNRAMRKSLRSCG